MRVAWSRDLGGLPVEPRVSRPCWTPAAVFEALGCVVEEATPDFRGADEVFQALRAWRFAAGHGAMLATHRDQMKDTVVWNIEEGLKLTGPATSAAPRCKRTELYHRVREFMERYEFLLCPVSQVPPFDVTHRVPDRDQRRRRWRPTSTG